MRTLNMQDMSEELYQRLCDLARRKKRSLSVQVIEMLSRSLEEEENRILDSIRENRFTPPVSAPISTDLLREDRDR